ncbi:uncharacterized protein LOC135947828 [Cloeon dipterum]|uniref:uncharacterized protein LOC135947828 n=1 Tax=Cloeon dipterum TaxID=197152 RepID=UPI00321F65EA
MDPFSPLPSKFADTGSPANNTSDNLISFSSPVVGVECESMLKPEKDSLGVVNTSLAVDASETKASPLVFAVTDGLSTSTPFECFEMSQPDEQFAFDKNLCSANISEDPFDYTERKATQDANDPFEMVLAAAKIAEEKASLLDSRNSLESQNSLMNAAFYASRTNLTSDFANLNLLSSGENHDCALQMDLQSQKNPKAENFNATAPDAAEGKEWIENEIPPWEDSDVTSADEEFLIDTVRRVSNEFPKLLYSVAEDLDTSGVEKLKLKSPSLKIVPETDITTSIDTLEVPNLGLRSIDLSFLDSEDKPAEETKMAHTSEAESLDEWKNHIRERASGFLSARKHTTAMKPFSKPLGSIDVNSPSGPRVATPVKDSRSAFKSNLPTTTFRSRLAKPRAYGANKENA